jgi:hypothetical protein
MLRFKNYLSEEVLPAAQVKDGSIDLEKPAVRGQINATLASVTAQSAVTPYIVLHKISKALAYFHIIMPKRAYLEGDKGVEVVELKQFGHRMGMTNDGQFVHDVPGRYFLFLSYRVSSSIGGGYGFAGDQLQSLGGSFKVTAKVVDEVELQSLLSAAEISLAENCDAFEKQQKYKAMAPKEPMHTALGDCDCSQGDSPSTKSAISTSMRKTDKKLSAASLDEERKRSSSIADAFAAGKKGNQRTLRTDGKSVTYHGNTIASHQGDHVHVTAAGYGHSPSTRGHLNSITSRFGGERFSQKKGQLHYGNKPIGSDEVIKIKKSSTVSEDKDPCWKGYEMIGMKKKGGKPVPNCVPVKEEQVEEAKMTRKQKDMAVRRFMSHDPKAGESILKMGAKDRAENKSFASAEKEANKWQKHRLKEDEQIDEISTKLARSFVSKAKDGSRTQGVLRARGKMTGEPYPLVDKKHGNVTVGHASPKVLTKEETQIDELKKSTLASYIKKAHVSGLEAASQGEIAYARKDKAGLHAANKTGEKREQGIERAANKLSMKESRMPASVIAHKQKLASMTPEQLKAKFAGKSKEQLQSMARRHGYGKDSDVYSKHVKEDTATTTGQKKLRVQHKTVVRKALGADKEKKTILVTKKGDPHAASGGGVRRIPKDKYDPSKYNLASE